MGRKNNLGTVYSAFTVAELGKLLPCNHLTFYILENQCLCTYKLTMDSNPVDVFGKTEADVRGKMLIYLLENKLITL